MHYLGVIGRLNTGATIDRARADLAAIASERARPVPRHESRLGRHRHVRCTSRRSARSGPRCSCCWAASAIVLLITCINVANVLLARATGRQRDLGDPIGARRVARATDSADARREPGAGRRGRRCRSCGHARRHSRRSSSLAPANLPRLAEVGPSVAVVTFALALSVVTGVAVGILPALTAARSPAQDALRESRRTTASPVRRRLRASLIVAEVRMAMALAVGAGLLLRSFVAVLGVDPGFQTDRLLTLQMNVPPGAQAPAARLPFYDELEARLRAIPGVTTSAAPRACRSAARA